MARHSGRPCGGLIPLSDNDNARPGDDDQDGRLSGCWAETMVSDARPQNWWPNYRHSDAFDRWVIHTYGAEVAERYGIRGTA